MWRQDPGHTTGRWLNLEQWEPLVQASVLLEKLLDKKPLGLGGTPVLQMLLLPGMAVMSCIAGRDGCFRLATMSRWMHKWFSVVVCAFQRKPERRRAVFFLTLLGSRRPLPDDYNALALRLAEYQLNYERHLRRTEVCG